jgi:cytochrome bd-type quinol oxidase subunit 1
MKEKATTKNYKKIFITLLVIALVLGAVTGAAIPLTLRTQISEKSVLREQLRRQYEQALKSGDPQVEGMDWDDYEDAHEDAWHGQLTPLNAANYVVIGVLSAFWLIVLVWYWVTVAQWLNKKSGEAGMNTALWTILGAFFNFLAVLAFLIVRSSPRRGSQPQ